MTPPRWSDLTWTEVRDLDRERAVPLLPVGAIEAHGPHLPLATDGWIAAAMAESAAARLARRGLLPVLLPPLDYVAAPFAAAFPGTLGVRPAVVADLLLDLGRGLAAHGFLRLAIANAHLDPANLAALAAGVEAVRRETGLRVAFPNLTRRPWALRLGEEFRSGACHAGRYEGSILLARRPDLVREERRRALPANPSSLSQAIGEGRMDFEAAGGPQAYFGDPASASAAEGHQRIEALGAILEEAVLLADRAGP